MVFGELLIINDNEVCNFKGKLFLIQSSITQLFHYFKKIKIFL